LASAVALSCSENPGTISLFNGVDLAGWESLGGGKIHVDKNHNLVTESACLMTDRNYDDFDLRLEFMPEGEGAPEVYYHFADSDTENRWKVGITPEDMIPGSWNELRLKVQSDRVRTWLNGKPVGDMTDKLMAANTGRIMLQTPEGASFKVKWRNIRLIPLGKFADDPIPMRPKKRTYIFNGKDLSDWDMYINPKNLMGDPGDAFKVEDGIIKVSGICLGGITTKTAWRDYRLHMEFRFVGEAFAERKGKAADGGLLFHCVGPEGSGYKDTWHLSFESNIIQGACCDMIMVECNPKQYSGYLSCKVIQDSLRYWNSENGTLAALHGNKRLNSPLTHPLDFRDSEDQSVTGPEKAYGEWNAMELVCDADRAEFYLNGEKCLEFFDLSPSAGRIQLQSEHHGIEYRNIYVESIDNQAK